MRKYSVIVCLILICFHTNAQVSPSEVLFDTISSDGLLFELIEDENLECIILVSENANRKNIYLKEKTENFLTQDEVKSLFIDINYDGHLDVYTGNKNDSKVYLFNPKSKSFVFQKFLSVLSESYRDEEHKTTVYTYSYSHISAIKNKNLTYVIFSGQGFTDGIKITCKNNDLAEKYDYTIAEINLNNEVKATVKKGNLAKAYFDKNSVLQTDKTIAWNNYYLLVRTLPNTYFKNFPGTYDVEFVLKRNGDSNDSLSFTTEFSIFRMTEKERTTFILEDYNFDGYPDLRHHNPYSHKDFNHYFYSNKEQKFEYSRELSKYRQVKIEAQNKRLICLNNHFDNRIISENEQVDTLDFNSNLSKEITHDKGVLKWKEFNLEYTKKDVEEENYLRIDLIQSELSRKSLATIELPYTTFFEPILQIEDFNFDDFPDFSIYQDGKFEYYFYQPDKSSYELYDFLSEFDTIIVLPKNKTLICKKYSFLTEKVIILQNRNLDFATVYSKEIGEVDSTVNYFTLKNDTFQLINENGFNIDGDKYFEISDSTRIEMTFEKVYNSYPGKDIPFQIPINIPFTCKLIDLNTNQDVFKMNYYNTTHLSKMTYDSLMRTQVNQFEKDIQAILIDQNKDDLFNAPYYFELESPYFLNNRIDKPTYNDFKVYSKETDSLIFSSTVKLLDVFYGRYSSIKIADFNFDSYPDFYIETGDWEKSGYYFYDENKNSFFRDSLLNLSVLNNVSIHFDEKKIYIATIEEVGEKQYYYLLSGKDLQHVKIITYDVLTINVKGVEKEENFYYDGKILKDEKLNPNYIDPKYNIQEGVGK